jgi:hypothetical protein
VTTNGTLALSIRGNPEVRADRLFGLTKAIKTGQLRAVVGQPGEHAPLGSEYPARRVARLTPERRKLMPKNRYSRTEIREALESLLREGKIIKRHDPVRGVVYVAAEFALPKELAMTEESSECEEHHAPHLKIIH